MPHPGRVNVGTKYSLIVCKRRFDGGCFNFLLNSPGTFEPHTKLALATANRVKSNMRKRRSCLTEKVCLQEPFYKVTSKECASVSMNAH